MSKELRALAMAAGIIDHNERLTWYDESELLQDGVYYAKNARFIEACSPDVVLGLLDRIDRQEKLLREQLTICRYLSKSICMTDETGADTNPDNIVESCIAAIEKELGE